MKPLNPGQQYGRLWRIALCGPRNSSAELSLPPQDVEYRLTRAYAAGLKAGLKIASQPKEPTK